MTENILRGKWVPEELCGRIDSAFTDAGNNSVILGCHAEAEGVSQLQKEFRDIPLSTAKTAKPKRVPGAYLITYPNGAVIVRHWDGGGWAFVPKEPYKMQDEIYIKEGGKISDTPLNLRKE